MEMKRFMDTLSPSLSAKVVDHDFYNTIQAQETFGYDRRVVHVVLEKMKVSFMPPGQIITR